MEKDLNKLRDRAYKCACDHGFHEKEYSDEHWLMLIITEISEAVNADRKNMHANCYEYGRCGLSKKAFETFIKDSVEDEISDVAIRLLDFAGLRNITIKIDKECYDCLDERKSFVENSFKFTEYIFSSFEKDKIDILVCNVITYLFRLAKMYNIDLYCFIEQKMKYNELRPYKNGKKY